MKEEEKEEEEEGEREGGTFFSYFMAIRLQGSLRGP